MTRSEKLLALCEAATNGAEDAYFAARPIADNAISRKAFCDGFKRGWDSRDAEVKRMVELMRKMRDALGMLDYGTRFDEATKALSEFDKWENEK